MEDYEFIKNKILHYVLCIRAIFIVIKCKQKGKTRKANEMKMRRENQGKRQWGNAKRRQEHKFNLTRPASSTLHQSRKDALDFLQKSYPQDSQFYCLSPFLTVSDWYLLHKKSTVLPCEKWENSLYINLEVIGFVFTYSSNLVSFRNSQFNHL